MFLNMRKYFKTEEESTSDFLRKLYRNIEEMKGEYVLPWIFPFSVEMKGNDSNLLIVFYVQIMPDDFVMQLRRF